MNGKSKPTYKFSLNSADYVFSTREGMTQFVVVNDSTSVIKVGTDEVTATRYEHIINADKMYISPVYDFQTLRFLLDPFVATDNPAWVYVYRRGFYSPGIYAIA